MKGKVCDVALRMSGGSTGVLAVLTLTLGSK